MKTKLDDLPDVTIEKANLYNLSKLLDQAYWLVNEDEEELSKAERQKHIDLPQAKELIGQVLDFLDGHKGNLILVDSSILDQIKYTTNRLEEVASKLEDVKVIAI